MTFWNSMDEAVRPGVERELKRKGWTLAVGGNHQWVAKKDDRSTEITTMNPFSLVEKVEAHEKKLRQQRVRRMEEIGAIGGSDDV